MEAAAAHLLNFSQPFDCELLEQLVAIAMDSNHPQRSAAEEFLVKTKDHPDMWRRADAILEQSKQLATKFFGLQVLTEAINTHWKVIPQDQREGIRSYIVSKIIALSSSEELMKSNQYFLSRLNLVLVQILKQDWPQDWPSFITDIVASSKTSESLCENNMKVLQLLSEEVFDFSKDSMTASKVKTMKESLNEEFAQVFQLCTFILEASRKTSLIRCTLQTLQRFLTWIPLGYIFETPLVPSLLSKFLPLPAYRVFVMDCLIEIASLNPADIPENYRSQVQGVLVMFVQVMGSILPTHIDIQRGYNDGSDEVQLFISKLALFLGTFLRSFLGFFDTGLGLANEAEVLNALVYMLKVSEVDDEEVFKTCLEFWSVFAKDLYTADIAYKTSPPNGNGSLGTATPTPKHVLYSPILHNLRIIMIDRMAKPEEILIIEDENGNIVREQTKDTEVIAQYKTMRESLVYLTNLHYEDTEAIMLEKLDLQVAGGMFNWNGLNTLCWAIGSISGAMGELDEKRFLVSVIKDLLRLCEEQKGKDNKAVVASNIMYIVGQYPRFLRAHWKFLKTVVNKLFEFMHEHHPGVQDMACDTFLKIAQKCKRKFMTSQIEDPQPFILTLIADLQRHIGDLEPHQVQAFYEAVGTMLSDQGPAILISREETCLRLMELQNNAWKMRMAEGSSNVHALLHPDVMKELIKILKINAKVCSSSGSIYMHQLSVIVNDLLNLYRLYSEQLVQACASQGAIAVRMSLYKTMRGVKSEILELFIACINVSSENVEMGAKGVEIFAASFMPSITNEVLADYHRSPAPARDAKVLTLFATAVSVLKQLISADIPRIMEAVFEKTLEMITTNMLDYPDHRIAFFHFLREANMHCFYGLFSIPAHHQKLVIDSVVWAMKHTERNISETGLEILFELLQNVSSNAQVAQPFYVSFLLPLIQDVFAVLTDRLHKSGFKLQAAILKHIFNVIQSGSVTAPLHSLPSMDNITFMHDHVASLLAKAFPNLTKAQIVQFVKSAFDLTLDINAFKQLLRDFLVTIKEFAGEDNSDLYLEEMEQRLAREQQERRAYMASVPGMLKPTEIDDPDL